MHTDLNVGMYWGDMGVDSWDPDMWKQQIEKYEVGILMMKILFYLRVASFRHLLLVLFYSIFYIFGCFNLFHILCFSVSAFFLSKNFDVQKPFDDF